MKRSAATNKQKLVISGSASLQDELSLLVETITPTYEILDTPKSIPQDNFKKLYTQFHTEYLKNITKTDIFLLYNNDKNGVEGYIGAESYAELCFAVAQNLIYGKNIKIYIYKLPSEKVQCYKEIMLWLDLNWINIWSK